FRVGDYLPISRSSDCEFELSFQIRLVEAGERHAGVHGNEERVDVLATIVLVLISSKSFSRRRNRRDEVEGNAVLSLSEFFYGKQNVSVLGLNGNFTAVYSKIAGAALAIVQQKRRRRFHFEGKFLVSAGCGRVRR